MTELEQVRAMRTVAEMVVDRSARQAAYIFTAAWASRIMSMKRCSGKSSASLPAAPAALITELTGQDIPLTDDAVLNACGICMRAFNAMRR